LLLAEVASACQLFGHMSSHDKPTERADTKLPPIHGDRSSRSSQSSSDNAGNTPDDNDSLSDRHRSDFSKFPGSNHKMTIVTVVTMNLRLFLTPKRGSRGQSPLDQTG